MLVVVRLSIDGSIVPSGVLTGPSWDEEQTSGSDGIISNPEIIANRIWKISPRRFPQNL